MTLAVLGLVLVSRDAPAHKLPTFPQVHLLGAETRYEPLLRRLTIEVRDPAGKEPVSGAEVTVRGVHATVGSGLRVEAIRLTPAKAPGTYQGEILFPQAGRWDLVVEVVGRYVGDAHFELEVLAPPVSQGAGLQDKPELPFDFLTVRHLVMEWGHLAGFALWLGATGVGLVSPSRGRLLVLVGTWAAFAIEGVTGLYKMEYSTPFSTPLQLFNLGQIPRVFFAKEYVSTLIVKHILIVMAMATTLVLTIHAWRTKREGIRVWRVLLGVNALLAMAIGGAAAVLGFYHAIVLHFS